MLYTESGNSIDNPIASASVINSDTNLYKLFVLKCLICSYRAANKFGETLNITNMNYANVYVFP